MHNRSLPPRPSLVQLRHEAKDLLRALRSGNPEAAERLRQARPRSRLSLQSFPVTQTYTLLESVGSMRIFEIRSDSGGPMLVQLLPPSVDL